MPDDSRVIYISTNAEKNWMNNDIQFPRLIAELDAVGAFGDEYMMDWLCDSMDLDREQIIEVVERASQVWDNIKERTNGT